MVHAVLNILRVTFSWIDKIIIWVMEFTYGLLIDVASLNIVNTEVIKGFSGRIGLVLGIFMLFNLAIKFLNYIVSPDKFSDKAKGGPKLILNIVLSLVLLVTYNTIFETGYKIQDKVLKKQIIPQIIFGTTPQDDMKDFKLGYYIFSGMISINPKVDTEGACKDMYSKGITSDCDTILTNYLSDEGVSITEAITKKDASNLISYDNITDLAGDKYVFNYMFIFSTIIGAVTAMILFNFCIDIAKRSVKLYFYQIIAPLPIVANMVPGKGEETFKKWYKSCFTTYLDLFIRLIALFFAIFLITMLYDTLNDVISGHGLVGIIVILGALMFAKELPQLLQDLTGIKLDGNFVISPIKKLNQVPVVGKGFGALGGAIAGGRAGGRVGNRLGGALTGALMGANSIPLGGSKDGKLALSTSINDVYKKMTGNEFINFSLAKAPLRIGAKSRIDEIKAARNVATDQLNSYNSQLNVSEGMTSNIANELTKKGININNLSIEKANLEKLKRTGNTISTDEYNSAKREYENLQAKQKELNELLSYTKDAAAAEDISKQMAEITSKMNNAEAIRKKFEANEELLSGIDNTLSMMEKYEAGMAEQNELRKRISTVQKDIDDLNKEKAQRERFYDYDPSPQEDIRKIMDATDTAESYEERIDDRVKPKE